MSDAGVEQAEVEAPAQEPSREDLAATGRHLSNAMVVNVLAAVREAAGDAAVEEVLDRAGERREVHGQTFLLGWSTLDQVVDLCRAAIEVTDDPDLPYRAGQWSFRLVAVAEFIDQLRLLGSPGPLYGLIGPVGAKVSSITDAEAVEVGETHAVIRYHTRAPHPRHPTMCQYSAGSLSSFPTVFGMAYADVTETACQRRGDSHCVYQVTWDPRSKEDAAPELRIAALEERIETLSARFETLERVSAQLSATNDVDTVLGSVVGMAGVAASAPHHLLAVRLPGERHPRVHAVGIAPDLAEPLAAELLGSATTAESAWPGPCLSVEVASARHRYGRLAAYYQPGHQFLPNEDRLLAAYAGHAAAALEAAVAFEETRLLLAFSAQLAEIATTAEMTARIAQAALRVVAADEAAVFLWEPADGLLVRSASAGWDGDRPTVRVDMPSDGTRAPSLDGTALVPWALAAPGEPSMISGDPVLEPLGRTAGCANALAVPLVARRQFLGALLLATDEEREFDEDVARRAAGVANLAASALHSARLLEIVQHQANHDTLTGLPNARLFGDRLTMALAGSRRSGDPLAVLFVDLDGFKDVNDRLGHAAGDRVLCEVAARLQQTVRDADSVARLGGDEFVVLMPHLQDPEDAETARRRIESALAELPVVVEGEPIPLQASVGLAYFPEDGASPGDLLHQADIAMYRNKLARRGGG